MEVADGGSGPSPARQAGYQIIGSGGGGAHGQYLFANLEEFDAVIVEWRALLDRVKDRGVTLRRAIGLIEPPAPDVMSKFQAEVAIASLRSADDHRRAMEEYAAGYVRKLEAARVEYAAADDDGAADLRRAGEGLTPG